MRSDAARGLPISSGPTQPRSPRSSPSTPCCVVSTGTQARIGPLRWPLRALRSLEDDRWPKLAAPGTPRDGGARPGRVRPARFLDLVRNFVSFSDERRRHGEASAKYHQFHAVSKAVDSHARGDRGRMAGWRCLAHPGLRQEPGDALLRRQVMRHPAMANPTVVVLTDRNDLDDQLFDEVFAPARTLPETPVQAESREHLRDLLRSGRGRRSSSRRSRSSGCRRKTRTPTDSRCSRTARNIVVMADEAHRTQYDFLDGFARHLRDALPNATFIGFTGTPIETADRSPGPSSASTSTSTTSPRLSRTARPSKSSTRPGWLGSSCQTKSRARLDAGVRRCHRSRRGRTHGSD